jgi:hypothetical protein
MVSHTNVSLMLMDTIQVHASGVVWANLLHNVFAALLTQHGYAADAKTNPNGTAGNQIWLQYALLIPPPSLGYSFRI